MTRILPLIATMLVGVGLSPVSSSAQTPATYKEAFLGQFENSARN